MSTVRPPRLVGLQRPQRVLHGRKERGRNLRGRELIERHIRGMTTMLPLERPVVITSHPVELVRHVPPRVPRGRQARAGCAESDKVPGPGFSRLLQLLGGLGDTSKRGELLGMLSREEQVGDRDVQYLREAE